MSKMINISQVSKLTGVTVKTLKIWDNEGKLKCAFKTVGGHRRYRLEDIERFIGYNFDVEEKSENNVFIYCRVSTKKQMENGNLERQKGRLINYCNEKGYKIINIFEETASGLNDSRRELIKMFKRIEEVDAIIIEYPDRLARFGYNYLKVFANSSKVNIESIQDNKKLESNEEMVQDLISIVTCFSTKLYGARGGCKLKKAIEELEKERETVYEDNNTSNAN